MKKKKIWKIIDRELLTLIKFVVVGVSLTGLGVFLHYKFEGGTGWMEHPFIIICTLLGTFLMWLAYPFYLFIRLIFGGLKLLRKK